MTEPPTITIRGLRLVCPDGMAFELTGKMFRFYSSSLGGWSFFYIADGKDRRVVADNAIMELGREMDVLPNDKKGVFELWANLYKAQWEWERFARGEFKEEEAKPCGTLKLDKE